MSPDNTIIMTFFPGATSGTLRPRQYGTNYSRGRRQNRISRRWYSGQRYGRDSPCSRAHCHHDGAERHKLHPWEWGRTRLFDSEFLLFQRITKESHAQFIGKWERGRTFLAFLHRNFNWNLAELRRGDIALPAESIGIARDWHFTRGGKWTAGPGRVGAGQGDRLCYIPSIIVHWPTARHLDTNRQIRCWCEYCVHY